MVVIMSLTFLKGNYKSTSRLNVQLKANTCILSLPPNNVSGKQCKASQFHNVAAQ